MKTSISFSEIKNLSHLSDERILQIKSFKNTDFSDNPQWSDDDWLKARPLYTNKVPKADVHVKVELDLLVWLKSSGRGYQNRLNSALRYAMQNGFQIEK